MFAVWVSKRFTEGFHCQDDSKWKAEKSCSLFWWLNICHSDISSPPESIAKWDKANIEEYGNNSIRSGGVDDANTTIRHYRIKQHRDDGNRKAASWNLYTSDLGSF